MNSSLSKAAVAAILIIICIITIFVDRDANIKSLHDTFKNPKHLQNTNDYDQLFRTVKRLEASVSRSVQQVNELACARDANVVTLSGGFCINPNKVIAGGNDFFDGMMCAGMEGIIGESSVGDFGAGLGHYGRCFRRIGQNVIHSNDDKEMKILQNVYDSEMKRAGLIGKPQVIRMWNGFDGAGNIQSISKGFIKYLDLSVEFDLGVRYDWIISLEVGEHIPGEYQHIFINNLVTHACKGIILTWAIPGQGGHHHVNNRNHSEIIKEFQTLGMIHDLKRQKIINDKASFYYFKRSLVFSVPSSRSC